MKKIIETVKNVWRIEDLRTRILITLLFIAIYRFGSFVVLPGIDSNALGQLQSQTSEGLMSLLNMFSGGAFSQASIFALGIMPYISASIVIQLLAVAVPYFQKMQREGESGRRKINQYTRWLTIAILLFQAPTYLINLHAQTAPSGAFLVGDGFWFMLTSTIILAAGSMFILWLGERITDKGIGNGVSLIIMVGIIARMPAALVEEFTTALTSLEGGGLIKFLFEIIALLVVMALAIMLVKATRKVPVQYAKRVEGNRQFGGARQYIPLKLFAANVMPIIFAQAIMFIPLSLAQVAGDGRSWALGQFMDHTSVLYNVVFVLLILLRHSFPSIFCLLCFRRKAAASVQRGRADLADIGTYIAAGAVHHTLYFLLLRAFLSKQRADGCGFLLHLLLMLLNARLRVFIFFQHVPVILGDLGNILRLIQKIRDTL